MLDNLLVLKKIKEGDIKSFEDVFKFYYSPLCIFAYSITGNRAVSEEIIQDVFYKIWKERESLQIFHSLKSYLYGAVRNQSLKHCEQCAVREHHRQYAILKGERYPDTDPHEELEYRELEALIEKTLSRIPDRRRKIFTMHRTEGLKYKEIAEKLSLSVKTIESEMTKSYQALRKEIEKYTYSL